VTRKAKRAQLAIRRGKSAGSPRATSAMTTVGKTGPRGKGKPTVGARARAVVNLEAPPTLKVTINSRETHATCSLSIGEILARIHTADLLDELQRRMRSGDFAVYADWLESRGDALGPALAIFTGQLAALRRGKTPPNTDKARFAGDQAGLDPGSALAALEQVEFSRPPFHTDAR
jgi:hypothetical protein